MGIEFSEAILLVSGGALASSVFILLHFISSYNQSNRSFAFLSAIIIGATSLYAATAATGNGLMSSFGDAMVSAIIGILYLLPVFLLMFTIVLFRISLLTNRLVDASS